MRMNRYIIATIKSPSCAKQQRTHEVSTSTKIHNDAKPRPWAIHYLSFFFFWLTTPVVRHHAVSADATPRNPKPICAPRKMAPPRSFYICIPHCFVCILTFEHERRLAFFRWLGSSTSTSSIALQPHGNLWQSSNPLAWVCHPPIKMRSQSYSARRVARSEAESSPWCILMIWRAWRSSSPVESPEYPGVCGA